MMDQLPEVNMAKNTELGSINEGNNDTAFGKVETFSGLPDDGVLRKLTGIYGNIKFQCCLPPGACSFDLGLALLVKHIVVKEKHRMSSKYHNSYTKKWFRHCSHVVHDGTLGGEAFQPKSRHYVNLSALKMLESVNMDDIKNTSTQTMFSIVNDIVDECIEVNNGDIPKRVASILKFVILEIQQRVSMQLKNMKKQSNLYISHEARYQSKIRVLETLVAGTTEENQVVVNQLQQIKIENAKIKEEKDLGEQDLIKVREEKEHCERLIVSLQEELKLAQKTYEENRYHLETEAKETKNKLLKKILEVECLLNDSRNKVKELQDFSESKVSLWKRKEHGYKHFIDSQTRSLWDLRLVADSLKLEISKIEKIYVEELHDFGENLKGLIDAAQNYNTVLQENRKLYNEVQDLKGNIRVYCRIRPFLPGQSKKQTAIQYMGENGELVVMNPLKPGKDSHRLFKFNKVFGPSATQEEVFRDTQPLIRSVLDGYNVCIFAYGQTGSGKTYTMTGPSMASVVDWGVNYRALDDLFKISQNRRSSIAYEVGVQMVEIYNEQVRDLLCNDFSQKRLGIWSTSQPNGLVVPDASMHPVKSTADVLELMHIGLMNRAVGATALNERSSRSHSILTVHVRGLDLETNAVLRGCLHLVDLAGSERVDRSEATGDRLREAQHINKSLSALGDVIFALAQKNPHVPYRNSKLTQVLQSSLGGQAKTLMFVQLNPDAESYSETVSTLKFAERVSGVELGAARSNKEGRDIRELMEKVSLLKDTVVKKDKEMARLRMCITDGNCENNELGSSKLSSQRFSGVENCSEKDVYDVDSSSENNNKHSDAGSLQSIDDSMHHKQFFPQLGLSDVDGGYNLPEDIGLHFDLSGNKCHNGDHLGFGNADFEDKLSDADTSDGVLSLGVEMDTPINSIARASSDKTEKRNVPVELPKPPGKQSQAGFSRSSLSKSSIKAPGPKRSSLSSSSAVKLSNRRQ